MMSVFPVAFVEQGAAIVWKGNPKIEGAQILIATVHHANLHDGEVIDYLWIFVVVSFHRYPG